jgi:hypothetical protein
MIAYRLHKQARKARVRFEFNDFNYKQIKETGLASLYPSDAINTRSKGNREMLSG